MHRFFAQRVDETTAVLPLEEADHALKVLRMNPGDECQALLEGQVFAAEIAETSPQVILTLGEALPSPEPSLRVTLFQGIAKGERMDYVAQKCTEAGIFRIVPVAFSRCVVQWDGKDAVKKQARFQRIAAEAAKQSGRALVPNIALPVSVTTMCRAFSGYDLVLAPWEEEQGQSIRQHWQGEKNVAIVIGPEGGISEEEIEQMAAAGAVPITLGPRIFRTETAGLATLISLLTLSGDLE